MEKKVDKFRRYLLPEEIDEVKWLALRANVEEDKPL